MAAKGTDHMPNDLPALDRFDLAMLEVLAA
jgi:hypothetical protein